MKKFVLFCLLALIIQSAGSQTKIAILPISWLDGQIRVTIKGVFLSTEETREGSVGETEDQYKLLITYQNTGSTEYPSTGDQRSVGVGVIKLITKTGAVYSPKYVGGGIANDMKPKQSYSTYLYSYNIQKGEQPKELLFFSDYNDKTINRRASIPQLIQAPLPDYIRIIELGVETTNNGFVIRPTEVLSTAYVVKGPFAGKAYGLYKPTTGYRFIYVRIDFVNTSHKVADAPLYSRDGEFNLEDGKGNLFADVDHELTLTTLDERLVRVASEADQTQYPIICSFGLGIRPTESVTIVKAFELKLGEEPAGIRFKLLGDIRELRINLQDH